MAWNAPATWVSGAILTAAQLNAQLRDNLNYLGAPSAAWTTFTPQLRTATTNRTSTVTYARYLRIGSLAIIEASVAATAAGGANEQINLALPTGLTYTGTPADTFVCGSFQVIDSGTAYYSGAAIHQVSGYIYGIGYGAVAAMGQSNPAMTMASGDKISYSVVLEVSP